MAISRKRKHELVEQYREHLARSEGIILADYRGMRVGALERLRRSIRDVDGQVQVTKNRLLKLALAETGRSLPDEWLEGTTLTVFCYGEVPALAKAISDFAKDSPLTVKGGLLHAEMLSAEQVKSLADLPSREVLLAQVLGTINAPASQVVGVVAGGIRQVLNVLQAYVDKLEGSSPVPQSA